MISRQEGSVYNIIELQNPKHIGHSKSVVNFDIIIRNGLHIFVFVTINVNPMDAKKNINKFII